MCSSLDLDLICWNVYLLSVITCHFIFREKNSSIFTGLYGFKYSRYKIKVYLCLKPYFIILARISSVPWLHQNICRLLGQIHARYSLSFTSRGKLTSALCRSRCTSWKDYKSTLKGMRTWLISFNLPEFCFVQYICSTRERTLNLESLDSKTIFLMGDNKESHCCRYTISSDTMLRFMTLYIG